MAELVSFSDMPSNWLTKIDGLGMACLVITLFLTITALIAVILRIYVRITTDALQIDDILMALATVRYALPDVSARCSHGIYGEC